MIALFGGIFLTYISFPSSTVGLLTQQAQPTQSSTSFLLVFVVEIAVIALILFSLRGYFHRGKNAFSILEAYIILFGCGFFFFFLLGNLLTSLSFYELIAVSFACALAILIAKRKKEWNTLRFRNLITLVSSIGAGMFIGISIGAEFGVLVLFAILGLFAVYDYLAVFVLKFMIPLAKQASNMNLAFMIGSSEMEFRPSKGKKNTIKKEELDQIKSGYVRTLIKQGNLPSVSSVMLGNGDIMLPLAVASGAYVYTGNIGLAIMIAVGAAMGLIATFGVIRKYLIGLPAIPPLFAFVSLALALYGFATGFFSLLMSGAFIIIGVFALVVMYVTIIRQAKSAK